MKPNAVLSICLCILNIQLCFTQNIGINVSGSAPSSSAIVDISSNEKGILIPRMTNAQRQALKDPTAGLIIYNTTSNQVNYYNGSGWHEILNTNVSSSSGSGTASGGNTAINTTGANADASAILDISSVEKGLLIPRTTHGSVSAIEGLMIYNSSTNTVDYYNGTSWNSLCNSFIDNTKGVGASPQGVAINNSGSSPDASAIVDISSVSKGLLIPRMTSAQRNAVKTPATGLMIYNTTTDRLENWNGSAWFEAQNNSDAPSSPTANAATNINQTNFDANWTSVSGATTYYLDVAIDAGFTSFVSGYNNKNVGNVTSDNVTGLTCGTTYYYRVTASNACGNSSASNTRSDATSSCGYVCGGDGTFVDARDGKTYGYVDIGAQRWMCQNLAYLPSVSAPMTSTTIPYYYVFNYSGTDVAAAKATTEYDDYGVLYNWPAAMNSATTSSSVPSGVQGACPAGWHIPSEGELCILESTIEPGIDPSCNTVGIRGASGGGAMKETGTAHWNAPNTGATNSSGFTARSFTGTNFHIHSTTEATSTDIWIRYLVYNTAGIGRSSNGKQFYRNIRCVKD